MKNDKIQDYFDQCPDGLRVEVHKRGIVLCWSRKGVGFGELFLGAQEDGRLKVDAECMGKPFVMELLSQALDESGEFMADGSSVWDHRSKAIPAGK